MTSNRSNLFHLVLLLLPTLLHALNTDGVTLLSFKYSILGDPFSVLQNWNYDDQTPCSWTGVTCTPDMFRVTSLVLPDKQLVGSVSASLFSIPHLKILDLSNNFLSGPLPDSVCNATQLHALSLGNNNVAGELPDCISNVVNLQLLNLSANAFTGKIPLSLTLLKNLTVISLAKNSFSGNIPSGFEATQILDLSSNLLNGSLPPDLGGTSLNYLNLSHNQISGVISTVFAEKVPARAVLDLSFNNLTGPIPSTPPFVNQKVESFEGNLGLCGQPLKTLCSIPSTLSDTPKTSETTTPAIAVMPTTPAPTKSSPESLNQTAKSKLKPSTIVGITLADIAALAIIGMLILYLYQLRKRKSYQEYSIFKVLEDCLEKNDDTLSVKKSNHQPIQRVVAVTSEIEKPPAAKKGWNSCIKGGYEETSSESDIENQLQDQKPITQLVTVDGETQLELDTLLKASAYVLGTSRGGVVYKAVLENGMACAVRRIGTESCKETKLKDFEREVEAIAKLRHPNLVRVRGFVWGNQEKLLISNYVPNGNLHSSSIYTKVGSQDHLSFEARLKIAKGIARGIAYIHDKKNVHGNLKPTNILLDSEFEAVITNTGLDRLLITPANSVTVGTKLSSHYHPPESLTNHKPNSKWDVYSVGVILLELLIGRVFLVNRDLVPDSEVKEKGLFMVDGKIRCDVVYREDEAVSCFRLGYACVSSLPQNRPSMKEVVQVLDKINV